MKVSIIISICDNREKLFKRSLDTWAKQSLKDFEIIIVDDASRKEIYQLCKEYKNTLKFQYINIDNNKSFIPIKTFTPALSNNVGFRFSRGEVVCITGPETLQNENNVEISYTFKNRKECGYGLVYKSDNNFVNYISENWESLKNLSIRELSNIKGAQKECLTRPPHPPAYWYFMAVAKENVEKIGGVDERFCQGFCAEDDDFANRMRFNGIVPVFEHGILGIHQDHSEIDKLSKKHSLRKTLDGKFLRNKNINLMNENKKNKLVIANKTHIWGNADLVIHHEFIGE